MGSPSPRVTVFFYGLFMDADLLRERGLAPGDQALASLAGMALRIGRRAALTADADPRARVHGVVMSLTTAELERLYAEPGLEDYRPQAVTADLVTGDRMAALCYNLPEPPPPGERDPGYAARLVAIGRKVGLPAGYLQEIEGGAR